MPLGTFKQLITYSIVEGEQLIKIEELKHWLKIFHLESLMAYLDQEEEKEWSKVLSLGE